MLRKHVDNRGFGMPSADRVNRRPRTVFFTTEVEGQEIMSDMVWELDFKKDGKDMAAFRIYEKMSTFNDGAYAGSNLLIGSKKSKANPTDLLGLDKGADPMQDILNDTLSRTFKKIHSQKFYRSDSTGGDVSCKSSASPASFLMDKQALAEQQASSNGQRSKIIDLKLEVKSPKPELAFRGQPTELMPCAWEKVH